MPQILQACLHILWCSAWAFICRELWGALYILAQLSVLLLAFLPSKRSMGPEWSDVFWILTHCALWRAHADVKTQQVSAMLPRSADARAALFWSYGVPALQGAWLGLHSKSSIYKHTADVDWDVSAGFA